MEEYENSMFDSAIIGTSAPGTTVHISCIIVNYNNVHHINLPHPKKIFYSWKEFDQ